MDSETAIDTGRTLLTWFTDYGALQILAVLFILRVILDWVGAWYVIKNYGFVISELVTLLKELRKERRNGNN